MHSAIHLLFSYLFFFLICIIYFFGFHDGGVGGGVVLSWPKVFPVARCAVNFVQYDTGTNMCTGG